MRDSPRVIYQVLVDDIRVAVVTGDQAERRIGILVDSRVKAGIDPRHDFGQVGMNPRKKFGVRLDARLVPFLERDVTRVLVQVNLALDQHEKIGLDLDA